MRKGYVAIRNYNFHFSYLPTLFAIPPHPPTYPSPCTTGLHLPAEVLFANAVRAEALA